MPKVFIEYNLGSFYHSKNKIKKLYEDNMENRIISNTNIILSNTPLIPSRSRTNVEILKSSNTLGSEIFKYYCS